MVIDTGEPTVMLSAFDALAEPLSDTITVNGKEPAAVGVPLMTPVAGLSTRPAGNAPDETDHVYGAVPPAAATVDE